MAWQDGTKIHRYTLSDRLCDSDFEAVLGSHGSFFTSQGSNHIRPISVLFLTWLKIFRILLSMNLIHLATVSYHQVCQERQFQTKVSVLFLTFYARATVDPDPTRS